MPVKKGKIKTIFSNLPLTLILILFFLSYAECADRLSPDRLQFRRQAVKRIILDQAQNIPLSELNPSRIVGLDVMHPPVGTQSGSPELSISKGRLHISSAQPSVSIRWVGSFSPFAAYVVNINNLSGSAHTGLIFQDTATSDNITVTLNAADNKYKSVTYSLTKDNKQADRKEFNLPTAIPAGMHVSLFVQVFAGGANILIENNDRITLIGQVDFVRHLDLRQKKLMQRYDFLLYNSLSENSSIDISSASSSLSPGLGQADLRFITYEDGTPYFKDNRLWYTASLRGRALPHHLQGVFSLDPSVFDIKFEGIIVFDRGDGLLRNDIASNLFYNRTENQWQGFTTGFSAFADHTRKEKKELWAVTSSKSPLIGLSIMSAKPTGLIGDYEDPQCIYDTEAGKWRMLLCENHKGYKAVIRESDQWDGPYKLIAGPVSVDSTGTQLQTIGEKRYALFGSADRKVHIYSYPNLDPVGSLNMHLPPWDDKTGTRIWPNVVPLPDGYPAPYIALMMDRLNFPGMQGPNWTYGAMYLYHGYPIDEK